ERDHRWSPVVHIRRRASWKIQTRPTGTRCSALLRVTAGRGAGLAELALLRRELGLLAGRAAVDAGLLSGRLLGLLRLLRREAAGLRETAGRRRVRAGRGTVRVGRRRLDDPGLEQVPD